MHECGWYGLLMNAAIFQPNQIKPCACILHAGGEYKESHITKCYRQMKFLQGEHFDKI